MTCWWDSARPLPRVHGRTWRNSGSSGVVGLLHPDTHFVGDREKFLRAEAYRRLRVHGDFVNSGQQILPAASKPE